MPKSSYKRGTSSVNKKKKNRKVKVISFFLILGILISLIYFLLNYSYFDLSEVEVSGFDEYTQEVIFEKYKIGYSTNIFIDYIKLKKNKIPELSYIDKMEVDMVLPNKLVITITPKESYYIAYDKDTSKYYLLDSEGYILKEADINMKNEEIILLDITFDDEVKVGTKINDIDYNKIITFCKIKSEYEKVINRGKITKVNFESSLTTITIDDKLNVIFPNDKELTYNMKFLKGIFDKLEEDPIGTIDMTKSNPSFSAY